MRIGGASKSARHRLEKHVLKEEVGTVAVVGAADDEGDKDAVSAVVVAAAAAAAGAAGEKNGEGVAGFREFEGEAVQDELRPAQ